MTRHPYAALALAMGITVFFGWQGSTLSIRTNIEDLFPEETPNVQRAQEARRLLASSSQIILAIESPDGEANRRFVEDLNRRLLEDPLVDSIDMKRDISFFKRNALLFVDEAELERIDRRVARAIREAVADDMKLLDDGDGSGPAGEDDGDDGGFDDGFDDGFGDGDGDGPASPSGLRRAGDGEEEDEDEGLAIPTEEDVRKKYNVGSLSEYNGNEDGSVIALKIYPSFSPNETARAQTLLATIQRTMDELNPTSYHPDLAFEMEGDYHSKIDEILVIREDLSQATVFALVVIVLLVALFFGSLRGVLFVMLPLLAGIAWTMGMAAITIGYLNLITAFIFAILFGLGVDFAVHATSRYIEERRSGKDPAKALEEGLSHLGRPMIAAAITTTVTFFSLVIFEFRGFSQFGLIAGVGVPLSLLAVYAFFPPLVMVLHRWFPEKPPRPQIWQSRVPSWLLGRKAVLGIVGFVLLATATLSMGLPKVGFEPDMKKVMTPKRTTSTGIMTRYRREVESRSASPIVLLTDSLDETRRVTRWLNERRDQWPMLQEFASVFSFVPDHQEPKVDIIGRIRVRLEQKKGVLKGEERDNAERAMEYLSPDPRGFTLDDLPDWTRKRFTDTEGKLGHFVLLYAHGNKADALVVKDIIDQLGQFTIDGKTFHSTASYYILWDAYDIVLREGPIAVLLALALVLGILILDLAVFRDIANAFLSIVIGLAAYLGFMGITGSQINMFNMIILPTVLGMGVDTAIHLLHRFREVGKAGIPEAANTTGAAAFLSAATTAVGFGSLAFATNPGLAGLGNLAPVGILLCYLSSLLLCVALGQLHKERP